jgi:hypothetical protein
LATPNDARDADKILEKITVEIAQHKSRPEAEFSTEKLVI